MVRIPRERGERPRRVEERWVWSNPGPGVTPGGAAGWRAFRAVLCPSLPCIPGHLCDPGQARAICIHSSISLAPGSGHIAEVGTAGARPQDHQVFSLNWPQGRYFQPKASCALVGSWASDGGALG